jgi:hypothetical protein
MKSTSQDSKKQRELVLVSIGKLTPDQSDRVWLWLSSHALPKDSLVRASAGGPLKNPEENKKMPLFSGFFFSKNSLWNRTHFSDLAADVYI